MSTQHKVLHTAQLAPIAFMKNYFYYALIAIAAALTVLTAMSAEYTTLHTAMLVVVALLAVVNTLDFLRKRKIEWVLYDDALRIRRPDLLSTAYYTITWDKVYEAVYWQESLVQKTMNYGTVKVLKTHGSGEAEHQAHLKDPKRLVAVIAGVLAQQRAVAPDNGAQRASAQPSRMDDLERLLTMKEQGRISDAEYAELKAKLL